jgi:hypothetical protein
MVLRVTRGLIKALRNAAKQDKTQEDQFRETCLKVYDKFVQTYNDMLVTNLAFLHGMIMPYYSWYVGLDEQHESAGVRDTLVRLHEHGVFTTDGQSNACESDYRERSYIDAFFPMDLLSRLRAEVQKRGHQVYYVFTVPYGCRLYCTNFTPDVFTDVYWEIDEFGVNQETKFIGFGVTQGKNADGQWLSHTMVFPDNLELPADVFQQAVDERLESVADIVGNNLCGVKLVVRDFCSPLLADQVLLECVLAADFPVMVTDPFRA